MLVQLGLLTFDTLLYNNHARLAAQLYNCHNCLIAELVCSLYSLQIECFVFVFSVCVFFYVLWANCLK